jgi:Mor family transcriptional regulator
MTDNADKYPEILADVAATAGEFLQKSGLPADRAADIGFQLAEFVRTRWGGHKIYISKAESYMLSRRDLEIWHAFDGTTAKIAELATKYNLSEMRIYQIIKRVKTEELRHRQPDFFRATKDAM